MEPKLPLVVLGEPGSGKSALLANWVKRRQENPQNKHEFLFQYFVDCSSESLQLRRMLHRLIAALKDHFNLREMEIPSGEERLRWGLIRFIEAAAKKYQNTQNARMVIVLDGVNRLQSPGSPDGTLKWLPVTLPNSVRFVVSTVERVPGTGQIHRSYQELKRRQCPVLRIQPLTKDACIGIMKTFATEHHQALKLDRDQQARVMDAPASSQPLFLRALLDSLRIGVELLGTSLEDQLERSLSKETPEELISFLLGQWTAYFDPDSSENTSQGILCWVLSLLYVSRHGLSDEEIQGAVTLAMGKSLSDDHRVPIIKLLKDMTMMVDGIRRFSNDALKQAIWEMYIKTPEKRLKLHTLLGKYFMKLPPCDRKLQELPYHLEISGHWTKLKQSLVTIDMFKWWWTAKHKEEFIKLWASLTAHASSRENDNQYVTSNEDPSLYPVPVARPCYDVVEEYTKSVDEFIGKFGKPDEEVSNVVLRIADFLLEFATSGHEVDADVPRFSRPEVLTADLASLGVPYLNTDENGRSCLNTPAASDKGKMVNNVAEPQVPTRTPAATDGLPTCSTYFYRRWMWIQFPLVALSNCGEKFRKGIQRRKKDGMQPLQLPPGLQQELDDAASIAEEPEPEQTKQASPDPEEDDDMDMEDGEIMMSKSMPTSLRSVILPRIPRAKQSGHQSRLAGQDDDRHTAYARKVALLEQHVSNYRAELDTMVRQRNLLKQTFQKLSDEAEDLDKMEEAAGESEVYCDKLEKRLAKMKQQQAQADLLSRNYRCVLLMCERHPPRSDVLIEDLENQMTQDEIIIRAVAQRLQTAQYESHATEQNALKLHEVIDQNDGIHNKMLNTLQEQHEALWKDQESNRKRAKKRAHIEKEIAGDMGIKSEQRLAKKDVAMSIKQMHREQQNKKINDQMHKWDKLWKTINEKTGIADPQVFFEKFHNRDTLEAQMEEMKKASEQKLSELKKLHAASEQELEEVRYGAFAMNGSSRELRDKDIENNEAGGRLKRSREKFTALEALLHSVTAGVTHIGEIIGLHKTKGQQQSTQEILELLEQLLTELLDEDDENAAHTPVPKTGMPRTRSAGDFKSKEEQAKFDADMNQRMANVHIVPNVKRKPVEDSPTNSPDVSDDEGEKEGKGLWGKEEDVEAKRDTIVPNRENIKDLCKSLKAEQRRQEKNSKRKSSQQAGVLSTN
jgi:hypothetical protein